MFSAFHADINSLKSGLLHFTNQPYCKKSRSAKVIDEILDLILRNHLVDLYNMNYSSTQKCLSKSYGHSKDCGSITTKGWPKIA